MAAENLKRGLSVIDPTLQKMGYMLRMILSNGTLYDNYMTPRNFSPTAKEQFSRSDPDVGTGFVRSRRTMHWIKMQIKVDQDSRKIVDVSYLPFGCPSVTACSSIASAWIKGKKIEQALEFKNSEYAKCIKHVQPVGCSLQRFHYTPIVDAAIEAAIKNYESKRGGHSGGGSSTSSN